MCSVREQQADMKISDVIPAKAGIQLGVSR